MSGFDPVRREIARVALEKLIVDGRIHQARIEEMVDKAEREVNAIIKEAVSYTHLDVYKRKRRSRYIPGSKMT